MEFKPGSAAQELIKLIDQNTALVSEVDGFEFAIQEMANRNNRLAGENDFLRWMFVMAMISTRDKSNERSNS